MTEIYASPGQRIILESRDTLYTLGKTCFSETCCRPARQNREFCCAHCEASAGIRHSELCWKINNEDTTNE